MFRLCKTVLTIFNETRVWLKCFGTFWLRPSSKLRLQASAIFPSVLRFTSLEAAYFCIPLLHIEFRLTSPLPGTPLWCRQRTFCIGLSTYVLAPIGCLLKPLERPLACMSIQRCAEVYKYSISVNLHAKVFSDFWSKRKKLICPSHKRLPNTSLEISDGQMEWYQTVEDIRQIWVGHISFFRFDQKSLKTLAWRFTEIEYLYTSAASLDGRARQLPLYQIQSLKWLPNLHLVLHSSFVYLPVS